MKSMKIMLSALLLSLSVGAYAQDDDELLDATEEEAAEVSVPTNLTERRFFQRVQLGYTGTIAKYTNNNPKDGDIVTEEKYFLSGLSLGWIGDLRLNQKIHRVPGRLRRRWCKLLSPVEVEQHRD